MNSKIRNDTRGTPQANDNTSVSFERLLDEYDYERPRRGQYADGTVTRVDDEKVFVDIGAKRDAVVPPNDLKQLDADVRENLTPGDEVPVYVIGVPRQGQDLLVSIGRGLEQEAWRRAEAYRDSAERVELKVTGHNRGGLLVEFGTLQGFVPNSHIPGLKYGLSAQEMQAYKAAQVGSRLTLKVLEVDRRRRRLVFSGRRARYERRVQRLRELAAGQVVRGQVTGLTTFGAFVDLDGIDGLIHISELDWRRVERPSDVLSVGDEVEVQIKSVDAERQRISLSRKALLPNPWRSIEERYRADDVVEGTVANVRDFGAFVELPDGIEGLIPHGDLLRQAAPDHAAAAVQTGHTVRVRIVAIEPERERMRLSLQQVVPEA